MHHHEKHCDFAYAMTIFAVVTAVCLPSGVAMGHLKNGHPHYAAYDHGKNSLRTSADPIIDGPLKQTDTVACCQPGLAKNRFQPRRV